MYKTYPSVILDQYSIRRRRTLLWRAIFLGKMAKNARVSSIGEVAEWSKAPVSKTGMPQGIEGSNPSLSVKVINCR